EINDKAALMITHSDIFIPKDLNTTKNDVATNTGNTSNSTPSPIMALSHRPGHYENRSQFLNSLAHLSFNRNNSLPALLPIKKCQFYPAAWMKDADRTSRQVPSIRSRKA